MSTSRVWRWVDVDGTQHTVGTEELQGLLRRGELAEYVLVWTGGWADWLHATNVAELAIALSPSRRQELIDPPKASHAGPPPAPALGRYTPFKPRGSLLSPAASGAAQASRVPLPRSAPLRRVPTHRPVLPTLVEEPRERADTLRPSAAIPPPPKAFSMVIRPPLAHTAEASHHLETSTEPATAASGSGSTRPAAPEEAVPAPGPRRVITSSPPPIPVTTIRSSLPPPVRSAPATAPGEASALPPLPPPPDTTARTPGATERDRQALRQTRLVLALTAAALAFVLVAWLIDRGSTRSATPPAPDQATSTTSAATSVASVGGVAAAAPPSPAATAPACRLHKPPTLVAPEAVAGTEPLLEAVPDSRYLALAFAASTTQASGITLHRDTLQASPTFAKRLTNPVLGVVPWVGGDRRVRFAVDDTSSPVASPRTVNAQPPFTLGVGEGGFVRLLDSQQTVLWPGKAEDPSITVPRVADAGARGWFVAFRHGGRDGKVLTGWLHRDGSRQSELGAVTGDFSQAGTPAVGASSSHALVAFAARSNSTAPWRLLLATAPLGQLPKEARPFAPVDTSADTTLMSPAIAPLGDHWLLQWTEGTSGTYAVRAQVLDAELHPTGSPLLLSTPGTTAGQGALWAEGDRAVGVFFVKVDAGHALWATALSCH